MSQRRKNRVYYGRRTRLEDDNQDNNSRATSGLNRLIFDEQRQPFNHDRLLTDTQGRSRNHNTRQNTTARRESRMLRENTPVEHDEREYVQITATNYTVFQTSGHFSSRDTLSIIPSRRRPIYRTPHPVEHDEREAYLNQEVIEIL